MDRHAALTARLFALGLAAAALHGCSKEGERTPSGQQSIPEKPQETVAKPGFTPVASPTPRR